MEILGLSILSLLIFIFIYTLLDRICKCMETKAMYNAYAAYITIAKNIQNDDIEQ